MRPDGNPEGAGALQARRRNLPLTTRLQARPRATPAGCACAVAPECRKYFRRERSAGQDVRGEGSVHLVLYWGSVVCLSSLVFKPIQCLPNNSIQ